MTLYTANALATKAGLTYRQVNYWTAQDYLKAVNDVEGSGNRRIYDDQAMQKALIMAALVNLNNVHLLADALVRGSQFQVAGRLVGYVEAAS